jgi:hypothetical protein
MWRLSGAVSVAAARRIHGSASARAGAGAAGAGGEGGRKWEHFDPVELRPNGVAIIRINTPGSVNTVTDAMRREVEEMWKVEVAAKKDTVKAVVWASAKKVILLSIAVISRLSQHSSDPF